VSEHLLFLLLTIVVSDVEVKFIVKKR